MYSAKSRWTKITEPRSSDYSTYKKISQIREYNTKQFIVNQIFLPSYKSFLFFPRFSIFRSVWNKKDMGVIWISEI